MAETVTPPRPGGSNARLAARRRALEERLKTARTGREVLALVADYFRSALVRADDETIQRACKQVIQITDREAGENHDRAAD